MKRVAFFICLLVFTLGLALPAEAQRQRSKVIKMELRNERLPQALKRLEKMTDYRFLFSYDDLNQFSVSKGKFTADDIRTALDIILSGKPVKYSIDGKYVNINIDEKAVRTAQNTGTTRGGTVTLSGRIYDSDHQPLPGATVALVGSGQGSASDDEGAFTIKAPRGKLATLRVSFIGMKTITRSFNGHRNETGIEITLQNDAMLDEVVVNGMFERKKESFTGSSVTFKKEDLEQVGNTNVIKSLANLDPSFQMVENIDLGSNPNTMPTLQLRGQTSFNIAGDYSGNANEPLFILDGFETTLEKIWDLDMNRVESVTILKDAAAKAVYGSKAGNGVVVIQTVRPKTGKIRISYNGNLNIEAPDLTGYNLMDAREKFDWEVAHHKYDNWQKFNDVQGADNLYKSVYDAIASGVDTYWLSKPLRTGIGQKHTVQLEGGDSKVRYFLGTSYNNVTGVMKGSDRNTFNINSTLSYTYKNMVFRNLIDYTQNGSKESPYGSFGDYVSMEPYFAPYDEYGNLKKVLGYETVGNNNPVYNPLYNASLNLKNEGRYSSFSDNFELDWHINDHFRFTGRFSYYRTDSGNDVFYPGSHTMFAQYDANGQGDRKGRYTKTNGMSQNISSQAGLSWNHMFGKHYIFLNGTWNMRSSNSKSTTVVAEGFGNDRMNDISMATYYLHDSHPSGNDSKTREVGLIGALNYSYDERYLFDATYRYTGSSVFGSDNHWGGFWSLGAGWNINKEKFFPWKDIVNLFKLRYSLGYTGTQNFNPYQAKAKYQYGSTYYDGRLGTTLIGMPNTKLKWQKVYDNNFGVDLGIGKWVTARFDYYVQNTSNLLSDITLPPSTGFTTYKENMGEIQNKGFEVYLGITPWRDNKTRSWATLTFSMAHNKNTIKKIYDIFKKSNDDADAAFNKGFGSNLSTEEYNKVRTSLTRPATRYFEGCSMTAIWGMRSLGIDPMSGKEMYLDKNGNVTYDWSAEDQVVIGDTNPKLHGMIGLSGGYKGFTLSVTTSYKLGGDQYNFTLIDRVENITGFGNLDKRVNEVWLRPGDKAKYRGVDMLPSPNSSVNATKPTSRFVQRNNELYISSINFGYDFFRAPWLKTVGLERLKISFYTTDLLRLSTIKVERGLTYPYARTFSLAVDATF